MAIMKLTIWELDEALQLIRSIQNDIWNFNYHLGLAGSVLQHGFSQKDLDLVILPQCNSKPYREKELIEYLEKNFQVKRITTDEYMLLDNRLLYRSNQNDKVIDWFIWK